MYLSSAWMQTVCWDRVAMSLWNHSSLVKVAHPAQVGNNSVGAPSLMDERVKYTFVLVSHLLWRGKNVLTLSFFLTTLLNCQKDCGPFNNNYQFAAENMQINKPLVSPGRTCNLGRYQGDQSVIKESSHLARVLCAGA